MTCTYANIEGFIKITNPQTNEILLDTKNAIHYENMSESLANSLANRDVGAIYSMSFGNGGSTVDPTGVITYLPPNVTGQNANLYNPYVFQGSRRQFGCKPRSNQKQPNCFPCIWQRLY